MDPASAIGLAFTVVQILQELIDLAQKLDDSLEKVKKNMASTKKLSFQILESLTQLKTFYGQHEDVLQGASDFETALNVLRVQLKVAYDRCNTLFVAPAKGRIGKGKAAFNAWLNRGKVETEILELKGHVQECHVRFTTMAAMHITANTRHLLITTARLEKSQEDMGKRVLKLSEQQQKGLQDIKAALVVHAPPERTGAQEKGLAPPPTTKPTVTPERAVEISEHVAAEMFVRSKIDHIDKSLTVVSRSETISVVEPSMEYTRPFQSVITLDNASNRAMRYDEVVQKILDILRVLQDPKRTLSIQEGAWDMVNLAIQLYHLEMYSEAVTIGTWTVDLFRTLVQSRRNIYLPFLGLSLLNLSSYLSKLGDIPKATSTIVECVQLNREMQLAYQTKELRNQLGRALLVSSDVAHKANDIQKALEDAKEAVKLFEDILGELDEWEAIFSPIITEEPSPFETESVRSPSSVPTDDDLDTLASATLMDDTPSHFSGKVMEAKHKFILDYASALHRLSFCLEAKERWEDSYDTERRAFIELRKIHAIYPGNFLHMLGEAGYRLSLHMFREWVSEEEALEYAQEATRCYRLLVQDSPSNAIEYYNSLWEHGALLGNLGRNDDAVAIWQEMVDFSKKTIKDQTYIADACRQISWSLRRLNRYEEAVTFRSESVKSYRLAFQKTTKFEADGQHDLANELYLSQRFEEAVEAQQEAVGHYRTLVMQDPDTYSKKLANALTQLCNYLVSVRQHDEALDEGGNALAMYEEMELTPEVAVSYVYCLRINMNAAFESDDEEASFERSSDCMKKFRAVFEKYPDVARDGLAGAFATHGFKLTKHNKTKEALKWSEDSLKWFEKQPLKEAVSVTDTYLATLINLGDEVGNLGQLKKALRYIEKAIQVGKEYCGDHESSYPVNACALLNRADMLLDLGKYAEGEAAAREAVEYAKAHPAEDVTQLAGTLSVHATALARVGRFDDAVVVGREALDVCRTAALDKLVRNDMFAPLQLPRSLRALADIVSDSGDAAKALEYAQEAFDEVTRIKDSPLSWSFVEVPYGACRLTFAMTLLLNGRALEAVKHLEELSTSFSARLQAKPGFYIRYVEVLYGLSWCYCALGQHEKGVETLEESRKVRKSLKVAFREISELTEIELLKESRRPGIKATWAKLNLLCGHQSLEPIL